MIVSILSAMALPVGVGDLINSCEIRGFNSLVADRA